VVLAGKENPEGGAVSTEANWSGNWRILPVVVKEDVLSGVDNTRLGVGRGVENLARVLV
jgi:hypothetical protein